MKYMPKQLTQPNMKLTYGKVVQYILDESDSRVESLRHNKYKAPESNFYKTLLDVIIIFIQFTQSIYYSKYISD